MRAIPPTATVLAGLAVFERQIHFLTEAVDALQNKFLPGYEPIPMHASPMRKGKDFWRNVAAEKRGQMVDAMGTILADADRRGCVLFAVAIEKSPAIHGEDAVQLAVEEICGRFNLFLARLHKEGDQQRGFLVFAEGRFHQSPYMGAHLSQRWNEDWRAPKFCGGSALLCERQRFPHVATSRPRCSCGVS